MKNHLFRALTLPLLLTLTACLENEEFVEVRTNGSVVVKQLVKGDIVDLPTGYNVPLGAPWIPLDDGAKRWLQHLGSDSGSLEVQARADALDWKAAVGNKRDDGMTLTVEAVFPTVGDWPRFYAPESEPYRSAYLERSASLTIEEKGDRTLYVFERTYHGRRYRGFDLIDRLEEAFSGDLQQKIDELQPLTSAEVRAVADVAMREHRALFDNFARSAFEMVYTHGSGGLPPEVAERARTDAVDAVGAVFTEHFVSGFWGRIRDWAATLDEESEVIPESPLDELEHLLRGTFRSAIRDTLAAEGLAEQVQNEVAFGIEWNFTEYDYSIDLNDEKFLLSVAMPGKVVGGNYHDLNDGRAEWTFESGDLKDRDQVMRVVSVLPK